jgi:ribosomal protein L29
MSLDEYTREAIVEEIGQALATYKAELFEKVDKQFWRLFNLEWKNQSERATERRMVISEVRRSIKTLIEGEK